MRPKRRRRVPENLVMAGARIEESVWRRFAARAKENGKSVAEALEDTLRRENGKPLAQAHRLMGAAGKKRKAV